MEQTPYKLELIFTKATGNQFTIMFNHVKPDLTAEIVLNTMNELVACEWLTDGLGESRFPKGVKPKAAIYTRQERRTVWSAAPNQNN
ncbi:DUF2922 domain-containing protein [Weissella diestrammenae]|uniref:DUF2922 domain-containing protein n=1 Tax=Weissella diestrammenae TaxID=1162633 RepID=A0A7G9T6N4_9LACO|nr:DUF2922 domain-containing protein [Weissella diestrammenae]MCM0582956.1 DUF2922 domain-containing protein [Weissella diestrammenae]QNN75759.1 DUF2922 domain-containing protein [Weissella diestrammenae]